MEKALSYKEISLVPQFFNGESRSECDTRAIFANTTFRGPWVPANMRCTISPEWAKWLSDNGYFYIMHRFNDSFDKKPNEDNLAFAKYARENKFKFISLSVGVKQHDKDFVDNLVAENIYPEFITIDIAHGHSLLMQKMIQFIRSKLPNTCIIAGNITTQAAVRDLVKWGANVVKVGVAQGGSCSTYGKTGFGMPMFTCGLNCCEAARDLNCPVILDGGVRTNGDFAKAVRAGATMVMAGSIFAACVDSPAENIYEYPPPKVFHQGKLVALNSQGAGRIVKKIYFGSASTMNKGDTSRIEGKIVEIDCNDMTLSQKMQELEHDLQSSISYAGGFFLHDLKKAEYNILS